MTVIFENESGRTFGLPLESLAGEVLETAMDYMECPYETQVSLLLTGDAEIHRLNLLHRKIDRPTDVLSFPAVEYETPGSFDFLEEEGADAFDPDTGELLLGDIVLSADRIQEQAKAYGHSVKREYAFLIAHSLLHLIGYDHETPEEAEEMETLQEEILRQMGIGRS